MLYIGIDIGTQSTKGILYNASSNEVLQRFSSPPYAINPTKIPGRAEQDPSIWIEATLKVLEHLFSKTTEQIKGIGISGQQHGMVVLDAEFNVLRPAKLWCDVEAHEQALEYSKVAGYNVPPGFTAPKVLWLKEKEPETFSKMRYCVLPHDFISFKLRNDGKFFTDAGDASGTGYFDIENKTYNAKLTSFIGDKFYTMLPTVLKSDEIAGFLSKECKEKLSIDYDVPISAGSGDNMMSALGVGCVEPNKGVLSLGTSATVFGVSSSVPSVNSDTIAPFCDATGNYLPLICLQNCTGVLQQVLESLESSSHEEMSNLVLEEEIPAGCHGVILLPYLSGERTPNWPLSFGALMNINTQNISKISKALIYRAALEGIAYAIKLASLELHFESLLVVGGGSKNTLWREILANVLGMELKFPQEVESAALGAAFQVGAAVENKNVMQFVMEQKIDLEDNVVYTSEDFKAVYNGGFDNFQKFSCRLFD